MKKNIGLSLFRQLLPKPDFRLFPEPPGRADPYLRKEEVFQNGGRCRILKQEGCTTRREEGDKRE